MSRSLFIGILLVVCILVAAAGCTSQPPAGRTTAAAPPVTIAVPDTAIVQKTFVVFPEAPLNETEKSDILELQEEEKFIADLNAVLATQHTDIVLFQNIANISKIYQTADNVILLRYGIPNPEKDLAGVFASQKLQLAYNNAINTGSMSAKDALMVDAAAEELHIADLEAAIGRTDNRDTIFIYRQELITSRNNLRAISQAIAAYGSVYTPKYLSPAYYSSLINSPAEYVPLAK
ncbi:MAG: DUF2202 domain-containing protein [Methanoregula sp.]